MFGIQPFKDGTDLGFALQSYINVAKVTQACSDQPEEPENIVGHVTRSSEASIHMNNPPDVTLNAARTFLKRLMYAKKGRPFEKLVVHVAGCDEGVHSVPYHEQISMVRMFTFEGQYSDGEPVIHVD